MYLKRLELYGFKSFADKTALAFEPGITLVVGPNGSGKSNIADAIRWVLGEQSAKSLRGSKMEDVIFAGSEKRKSLGMAEVSLTLDNSSGTFPLDFQEVTVTRRLYRSGESEYLINKVPCRLRDIHEVFMDTGVGREGFSMIGQGRVEEILLSRPEEKRMILEDAAGIVKYRYRKKEAAKKLEETGQHLLRIEDLLLELRSQEEPLARQAAEARQYTLLKEELDSLEMGMMVGEIRQAKEKLQNLQAELGVLQETILSQRTGFLSAQSEEESLRLDLDRINEQVSALQEEIYRQSLEREKLENSCRTEQQRSEALEEQAKDLDREVAKLEEEWRQLSDQWEERKTREAALAEQVGKARQVLAEEEGEQQEAETSLNEKKQALETGDEDHFELLRKDSSLQNREVGYREQLSSAERQRQRLAENRQKLAEDRERVRQQIEAGESRRAALLAEKTQRDEEIGAGIADVEQTAAVLRQKQQDNRAQAAERGQAMSRYKLLEEMEKEGQGYAQGVREILQRRSKDRLPGILGTVAQSLRVDKEYELAVETALGYGAQNIITETERSAQDAIRWLKNYDKGRVTFLPLDTIKANPPKGEGMPRGKGVLGRMVDLVDFEDRYLPAMEYLMGRIWLVDELSNAVARARETGFRYRMVTLDGQVVNAGGSLTGGSTRQSGEGFISRRRQLEELDREIRQLSQELVAGEEIEGAMRIQWEAAKAALEERKEARQQAGLALAAAENDLGHSRETEKRLLADIEMMVRQQEEGDLEKAKIAALIVGVEQERQAMKEAIDENRRQIESMKEEIALLQSQRAQRQSRLTELRIQLAGDEEKLNSFDKEGSFIRDRMAQLQSMITSQKENAALCLSRSKQYLQSVEQHRRQVIALDGTLAEAENEKQEQQEKRRALQLAATSLDENQKAMSEEMEKNQERRRQMQIQEGRLQANLEEWTERLTEQFALDWEKALDTVAPIQERRKGQQRVKEIREEIAALPPVNLAAVEEYEKLVERLAFLTEQMADLVQGKADLETVIREMDALVAKKFQETFEEVNRQFNLVFQRLFAGGRADLVLTQPENLLETGVDIIAQPPGKKLQHMSLLSGGEKALTAIALLMAMLRVRPSPFSILDEIESNLDEANVERFAGLIKDYKEGGGQFIIITHRRGTMTIGDVIYGVSAQEFSGVSKILSVRMEEDYRGLVR